MMNFCPKEVTDDWWFCIEDDRSRNRKKIVFKKMNNIFIIIHRHMGKFKIIGGQTSHLIVDGLFVTTLPKDKNKTLN